MISIVLAVLYTTLGTWYFHLFFDEPHLVAMGVDYITTNILEGTNKAE